MFLFLVGNSLNNTFALMNVSEKQLKEIGKNLRKIREEKRISQKELAEMMEVLPAQYGKVENGKVVPSVKTLLSAAHALDTSLDVIVYGESKQKISGQDSALINTVGRISKLPPKERFMANELLKLIFTRDSLKNIVSDYEDAPDSFLKK